MAQVTRRPVIMTTVDRVPPVLTEEEKRKKALEFQAQIAAGAGVTRKNGQKSVDVTPAGVVEEPAADGRAGRGGKAGKGQKIAKSSAAARAPQAGAARAEEEPEIPERLRTNPNRKENEFMMNLMVLRNTLSRNAPACRERARMAGKWIWRDIRLMLTLVNRIQTRMLRTMPEKRDAYYLAYAQHGHYELHMDGPVRTARHILVTDKHAAILAEAAMKSECPMCFREGSEIGQCPLREALLESAPPSNIDDGDSMFRKCEYRDAVSQIMHGETVQI